MGLTVVTLKYSCLGFSLANKHSYYYVVLTPLVPLYLFTPDNPTSDRVGHILAYFYSNFHSGKHRSHN